MQALIPQETIAQKIFLICGHKVMLSTHLAHLYGVEPKVLVQAVKRNLERFPRDFMFQLNAREFENLKSQFVTSSWGGLRRALPYAFTAQGVAMLSSVLRSKRAIQMNVIIMRAFVRLRQILSSHKALAHKLVELEKKFERHDHEIRSIFDAMRQLLEPAEKPRRRIGFHAQ